MEKYISVNDYAGNKVTCSRQQWFGHIVKNHAIMSQNKEAVEETVNQPDKVYRSEDYENRRVFFKVSSSATYSNRFHTKVIVEYNKTCAGEIVTAFPTKDVKGGIGDVIYPE